MANQCVEYHFAGRLIIALETTRTVMVTKNPFEEPATPDRYGREPFQHRSLANVDKLGERHPRDVASKEKLTKLAMDIGLTDVVRWKPRMVSGSQRFSTDAPADDFSLARKPRKLGSDRRSQLCSLCHRRCDFPPTRRRGRPAGRSGEDSEEVGRLGERGVMIDVYNSVPYQGAIQRLARFLGLKPPWHGR